MQPKHFGTLQTDFLFDGDGATVQRTIARDGLTGRDLVSVEAAELCAKRDPWAIPTQGEAADA